MKSWYCKCMNLFKDDTKSEDCGQSRQCMSCLKALKFSFSKAPIQVKWNTSIRHWSFGPAPVNVFGSTGEWDCPPQSTEVGFHG